MRHGPVHLPGLGDVRRGGSAHVVDRGVDRHRVRAVERIRRRLRHELLRARSGTAWMVAPMGEPVDASVTTPLSR